jgi:penicillin-binding protein 2
MQRCTYLTTILNRGTRYKATFLNRVVSADYREVVFENTTQIMSQIKISNTAVNAVMQGMEKAAHESGGTARRIFGDYPIRVAAKTGTAQTGDKRYSDNGAFVCYAPADDPQIAVVVYGERAGHGRSMGDVAKAILDAYFGLDSTGETLPGENEIS